MKIRYKVSYMGAFTYCENGIVLDAVARDLIRKSVPAWKIHIEVELLESGSGETAPDPQIVQKQK